MRPSANGISVLSELFSVSLIRLLCNDLQSQVEHGPVIAVNITTTCEKQVEVLGQFKTAANIKCDIGTSTRLLLRIAEQLDSKV